MPKLTKKMIENLDLPESGQVLLWGRRNQGIWNPVDQGRKGLLYPKPSEWEGPTYYHRASWSVYPSGGQAGSQKQLQNMATGIDPAMVKKQQKLKSITLGAAAETYKREKADQGPVAIKGFDKAGTLTGIWAGHSKTGKTHL